MTSRMRPDSQSACVFFLAALCLARAQNSSRRLDETLADRADVDYVTKCSWNCTIAESDLTDEIKSTIVTNGVIRFEVRYEKKIGEKCINETSGNPSKNVTENWQIWLANNKLNFVAYVLESWTKLIFSFDSGRRKEIKAVCKFEATRKTEANSSNDGLIFPLFVPGHLADLGVEFDRIECKTKKQSCANSSITALWENFLGLYHMYKAGGWSNFFINLLLSVFLITFFTFSPAFVCFFSPTQVTENGMRQIVLNGASPVSFPSFVDVGATPLTKALVAFFTGSVPKIATMYFDGDRQKKLEAIEVDENAPQIVEDYLSRTPESVPEPESFSGNNDEALPVLINHTMRKPSRDIFDEVAGRIACVVS
ncbi:uncharacterized protein [Montipora foliosa]|uniref:uncharacterized protein isoform X2 n=1 Tax=Montipora foliosa TaxID=591990 RepID=UPI0035F1E820